MAVLKTRCPECNAPLKSPTGFAVGQTVCCPKCETYFAVKEEDKVDEKPEDEPATKKPRKAADEDDRDGDAPKKRRAYDDDEEPKRSYKDSPLRYAILGVLVVTMLVLGYFLIRKWQDERELAKVNDTSDVDSVPAINPKIQNPLPGQQLPMQRPGGVPGGPGPNFPNAKQPNNNKQPNVPAGGPAGNPLGGLLGGPPPAQAEELRAKYVAALVGTWTADLGDGVTQEMTYNPDGTFAATLTGPAATKASGKYTPLSVVGTKSLKVFLQGTAPRTIVVVFDGDVLEHPTLLPGVTGTFRKK